MRRILAVFLSVAFIGASVALVGPLAANASASCAAVHFVGVRGSGEAAGFGDTVGPVANSFTNKFALAYPAAPLPFLNSGASVSAFISSVDAGVSSLQTHLAQQAAACPSQKFVLAGYSQGALVIDKALVAEPSTIINKIKGIALFGDPMFRPGTSYDVGTYSSSREGVVTDLLPWYANNYELPTALVNKTQDYCIAGDPVCNYGIFNLYKCSQLSAAGACPHQLYVSDGYATKATAFLKTSVRM